MSNPPVGWYPDPTGQPHTIRFWDGAKWTNKTKQEDPTLEAAPAEPGPTEPGPTAVAPHDRAPDRGVPDRVPDRGVPEQDTAPTREPAASQQDAPAHQPWPDSQAPSQAGPWSADQQPWAPDQFSSYEQPQQETPPRQEPPQQQPWPAQQPQQGPDSQGPAWSADSQPWSPDQFSSYDQPAPDAGQPQQQDWSGQPPQQHPDANQGPWTAAAQPQPQQPDANQAPWTAEQPQQDWSQQGWSQQGWSQQPQQQSNNAPQGTWTADPQQWSADQFTSYDQPAPDAVQPAQDAVQPAQDAVQPEQQPWPTQQPPRQPEANQGPWTAEQPQQDWSQQPQQHSGNAPQGTWTADPQQWSADQFTSYDQPDPDTEQTQQQPWTAQQDWSQAPTEHPGPPDPSQHYPAGDQQPWTADAQQWSADQFTSYDQPAPHQPAPPPSDPHAGEGVQPTPLRTVQGDEAGGPNLRAVHGAGAAAGSGGDADRPDDGGGWWQPTPTADLWASAPSSNDTSGNGGARLRAVSPDESVPTHLTANQPVTVAGQSAQPGIQPSIQPADDLTQPGESARTATTEAAARARATWGAPELAPAPPEHWTQREISPELEEPAHAEASLDAVPAASTADVQQEQPRWTLRLAPDPADAQVAESGTPQAAETQQVTADTSADAAADAAADDAAADDAAADDAAAAALMQPDWGSQGGDEQEDAGDVPAWGVEADDEADSKSAEEGGPLWTVPQPTDAPQEQPVQLWGDKPNQTATTPEPAQPNLWGTPQAPDQQNGQSWEGQSWPVQQVDQQGASAWNQSPPQAGPQTQLQTTPQTMPQTRPQTGPHAQPQWNGGTQQAWGDQQAQPAWSENANEPWGGQADLSVGVGKRDGGKGKKKSKGSGGGGPLGGAKLPLVIAGGVALVMLIVAAVVLLTNGDDKTANPEPTGTPTQSTTPTNQSSTKPGQSKNPALHEGADRISSDAISFPRRNPPWSDRKRLVPQLLNSNGQRIVLKENAAQEDDWSADIFVGALGTGSGFRGDPKATASSLSLRIRTGMYGNIPVTYKTVANGPVKRSGKSGWVFVQTVTTTAAVTDRVLTLTVAVFDLGDGTAVAYISGIPNTRPDLKTAADQAYLGIQVG
ncbi:hypothetical protein [Kribbella sp. NPDC048915]|uniref:hypothetical protein n=1 Tax=Kribbella sp. NPDC048915 TaxID=3155148 RepID=UPI0033D3AF16